jgi:Rieske Fe-S protein
MGEPRPSRRIVFHGLSALGVAAVLAGCGGDDADPAAEETATTPSPSDRESSTPSEPADESPSSQKDDGAALATTDEVPVGGGIVLADERIVLTQPTKGDFQAFSAVCKHQGQTVGKVEDNVITCLFHGSQYDAATGDVVGGPAPTGLDPIRITVSKGRILRA